MVKVSWVKITDFQMIHLLRDGGSINYHPRETQLVGIHESNTLFHFIYFSFCNKYLKYY